MPQLLFEMTMLKLLKIPELSNMDKILGFITALKKAGGKIEIKGDLDKAVAKSNQVNQAMSTFEEKKEEKEEKVSAESETNEGKTITIDEIRAQWQNFTQFVGDEKKKILVKSFLRIFYPYEIKQKTI